MISAAAVEQAAELLCDREGIAETLTAMKAAKFCRIEFTPNDPNKGTANWRASAEMKISAPIRQLLQAGVQNALLQPGQVLNVQDAQGGPDRPGKVLAVVPAGVPIEHAIADQNGKPRQNVYTLNRKRSTLYVIEVQNPDGSTSQAIIAHKAFAAGLANAAPREPTP